MARDFLHSRLEHKYPLHGVATGAALYAPGAPVTRSAANGGGITGVSGGAFGGYRDYDWNAGDYADAIGEALSVARLNAWSSTGGSPQLAAAGNGLKTAVSDSVSMAVHLRRHKYTWTEAQKDALWSVCLAWWPMNYGFRTADHWMWLDDGDVQIAGWFTDDVDAIQTGQDLYDSTPDVVVNAAAMNARQVELGGSPYAPAVVQTRVCTSSVCRLKNFSGTDLYLWTFPLFSSFPYVGDPLAGSIWEYAEDSYQFQVNCGPTPRVDGITFPASWTWDTSFPKLILGQG